MRRPSQSLLSLGLVLLCFHLYVFAITTQQIGLKLNKNLADEGKYAYNAIVQVKDDVLATWSDEEIVGVAQQAYNDMQAAYPGDRRTYTKMSLPRAMSVIVQGHSLYISSSMTGGGSLLYIPNQTEARFKFTPGMINLGDVDVGGIIAWALGNCQASATSASGHRTGGNCGEPMAALVWATVNPTGTLDGAKVVTWGKSKVNGATTIGVMDPCGSGAGTGLENTYAWGCKQFTDLKGLNMITIGAGTQSQVKTLDYNPTVTYACFS